MQIHFSKSKPSKTDEIMVSHRFLMALIMLIVSITVLRIFVYGLYQVPSSSMETTMLIGERFIADKCSLWFRPIAHNDIIIFNDPEYSYSSHPVKKFFERFVWGPAHWTKRVIGIPGDHIEGKIEYGRPVIYRNGKKLEEPYVNSLPLYAVCDGEGDMIRYKSFSESHAPSLQPYYHFSDEALDKARQRLFGNMRLIRKQPQRFSYTARGRNADIFDVYLHENHYWVMGDNRCASFDSRFWGKSGKALSSEYIHGRIVGRLWSVDSDYLWIFQDFLKAPLSFFKKIRWSRCFQWVN